MATNTLQQIETHLQFLGYAISHEDDRTVARHPTKYNMLIKPFVGGFLFTTFFGCTDLAKRNRLGYLNLVNTLNAKATVARYYVDKDSDLVAEAWHFSEYERTAFGIFMDALDRDHRVMSASDAEDYIA